MQLLRRQLIAAGSASLLLPLLPGCATPPREDFKPVVGQAGKDVIWVPTPDAVVERMLDMAEVKRGERVVDLGSGDGKIAIAAAKRGARARGIEFNPDMVALSRRNAREAGVEVDFAQGDIFQADFSDADVVTLYLLPNLNEKLRPILLDMKPGTRVTSHQFTMGPWTPDRTDDVSGRDAHLWIVPAKVGGTWTVRVEGEPPLQVELRQQFQQLEGDALVGGERFALELPRLRGPAIRFDVRGGPGGTMRFEGTADNGGRMDGMVATAGAQPRRFTATRS
ncbi:methyltransferase domain-containing protein [Ramlibacter henchirensis]|uniref:Methyltransferase domain-containing protein n=1 Tax=Ramlibacter henchirensis TaxID=204072 RepID=A0A4Z0BSJ0_9BURK|nr:methyltransferase domain-containing protein [Ramlibacter henchirensis]TFZ02266.1 methyltransferase domain-containing protein [Ramlibacter henchirensis]